jgi:hypothetical protein
MRSATYNVMSCSCDEDARDVLRRPEFSDFDCIPVRDRGRVTGVLLRDDAPSGGVAEAMTPLDEGLLVAADEPLKAFLPLLLDSPRRLVVRGATIEGIVTASDVLKLPARLLAFAIITHLEMTMADVIARTTDGDDWLQHLSSGRQERVRAKLDELHKDRVNPNTIEVTDFCDKREILLKLGTLTQFTESKGQAREAFKAIEELRNMLAHGATYAQSQDDVRKFVLILASAEAWIVRLAGRRTTLPT